MTNHHINHKSPHQDINLHIAQLNNTITETINDNVKKIKIQPNKIDIPPFIRELIKEKGKPEKSIKEQDTPTTKHITINLIIR